MTEKRPVLVSACLLGIPCRWHGKKLSKSTTVRRFERRYPDVELVAVCPEQLGGLPTPRPPVKRIRGRVFETCAEVKMRGSVTGRDVTAAFHAGAEATLAIAQERGCELAILCQWSPSCDRHGVTGRLLARHGLRIINTF